MGFYTSKVLTATLLFVENKMFLSLHIFTLIYFCFVTYVKLKLAFCQVKVLGVKKCYSVAISGYSHSTAIMQHK